MAASAASSEEDPAVCAPSAWRQALDVIRFFHRYGPWRLPFLFCAVFLIGLIESVGLTLFLPLLTLESDSPPASGPSRWIHEALASLGLADSLEGILGLIVAIFLAKGVLMVILHAFAQRTLAHVLRDVRLELTDALGRITYLRQLAQPAGTWSNLLTLEADRLQIGLTQFVWMLIALIQAIVFVAVAFLFDARASLLILLLGAASLYALRRVHRKSAEVSRLLTFRQGTTNALLVQIIRQLKYIRATAALAPFQSRLGWGIRQIARHQRRLGLAFGINQGAVESVTVVQMSIVLFLQVRVFGMSLYATLLTFLILYRAFSRAMQGSACWQQFLIRSGSLDAIQEAIRYAEAYPERSGERDATGLPARIEAEGVAVGYGEEIVLRDLTFAIPANRCIGVVGRSGAGKTTLFDLLTGLLRPAAGTLRFGGVPYGELDLRTLRRRIGYVTQDAAAFEGTVRENVTLWESTDSDAEKEHRLDEALRQSHCMEFIERMEKGIETRVGENGVRLSGGQRQRLAIARELYKDPDFFIFDEATSSLDTESETHIHDCIRSMRGRRTMLIIAHRLASVRDCDEILVLADGGIAERGTFSELYARPDSRFRRMCDDQGLRTDA